MNSESVLSAALEDAEGRALVEDIVARKKARNIRERFFQQLVWGDVLTDGHGNVIPRELPGPWKSLQAAAVSGGGVEYARNYNKPDTISIDPGGDEESMIVWRGPDYNLAWWDEQLREAEQFRARLNIVASKGLAADPAPAPAVGTVRWACTSPTGEPPVDRMAERWADFTRGMADGLAGRAYAETRQEARLRDIITDPRSGVRA